MFCPRLSKSTPSTPWDQTYRIALYNRQTVSFCTQFENRIDPLYVLTLSYTAVDIIGYGRIK